MILMLFHLFCMLDDFWRMNCQSQDSDGKSGVQMQYSRRSENSRKYMEIPIFPEDEGCQKGERRWATGGPHHPLAQATLGRATRWCGHPGPPLDQLFGVYIPHETLRLGVRPQKDSTASTRRKTAKRERALRQAEICRGNSVPERGDCRHQHHHQAGLHRYHDHHHHHHHHQNPHHHLHIAVTIALNLA